MTKERDIILQSYATPYQEIIWNDPLYKDVIRQKLSGKAIVALACLVPQDIIPYNIVVGQDYIKSKFELLREQWFSEVMFSSNPMEITTNRYYWEITKMGTDVVPYLIQDMKTNHTHWFKALQDIFGVDPIQEEHYGDVPEMINDWIQWIDFYTAF